VNTPKPIGILDSGVGGLSVLREIRALLPHRPLLYIGDSAHCPYGNKAPEVIQSRVFQLTDYLLEQEVETVVIACNSATIAAVEALRAAYPVTFVGMEPAIKPAASRTMTGVVGVLATEASLAGEKFHRLVDTHAEGVRVITRQCADFVRLVEAGTLDGPEVDTAVKDAVTPLLDAGADVLVLGCTHYPFLRPAIAACAGPDVQILDTGTAVARRTAAVLEEPDPSTNLAILGRIELSTTGPLEQLERLAPRLLSGIDGSFECQPLDL